MIAYLRDYWTVVVACSPILAFIIVALAASWWSQIRPDPED